MLTWTQIAKLSGANAKRLESGLNSLFLASYYQPHARDVKSLDELEASLLKLGDKLHKHVVIVAGDFNAPNNSQISHGIISRFQQILLLLQGN